MLDTYRILLHIWFGSDYRILRLDLVEFAISYMIPNHYMLIKSAEIGYRTRHMGLV